jgi:hypothetical protein
MGVVWDLAEAINLGLGVASGSAVRPIEAKVHDVAFRSRLARTAKNQLPGLSEVKTSDLVKLFADTEFLNLACAGDLHAIANDEALAGAFAPVAAKLENGVIGELGRELGALFTHMALEEADPIDRVVYEKLLSLNQRIETMHRDQVRETAVLRDGLARYLTPESEGEVTGPIRSGHIPSVSSWFMGRDALTRELNEEPINRGHRTALVGLGGIGKTTMAAAYVREHWNDFGVVCWISAGNQESILAGLTQLGHALGIAWPPQLDAREQAKSVLNRIGTLETICLLVYDNAPDRSGIEDWLPSAPVGRVLITSRNRNFDDVARVIEVSTFSAEDAELFLRSRTETGNRAASNDINGAHLVAGALDGLPLALEQAGAYVARSPVRTWQHYAHLLAEVDLESAFSALTRPAGYPETVLTTWMVSVDAAESECAVSSFVLQVLAHFAAVPIPFIAVAALDDAADGEVLDAITALHSYSLVTIQTDASILLHRLVQSITRASAHPAALDVAAMSMAFVEVGDENSRNAWSVFEILEAHLRDILLRVSLISDYEGLRGHLLAKCTALASAISMWRSPVEAVELLARIAQDSDSLLGDNDPNAMRAAKNLGVGLIDAGRAHEALPILLDVLDRQCASPVAPPSDVEATVRSLAIAYSHCGNLDEAAQLRLDWPAVFSARESEPIRRLMRRSDSAFDHQRRGDADGAYAIFQEVVPDLAALVGADHPQCMKVRQGLAMAAVDMGLLPSGLRMYRELLDDKRRVLGNGHPSTLRTWTSLGHATFQIGDFQGALDIARRVAHESEQSLGRSHAFSIEARQAVAVALGATGSTGESLRMLEEAWGEAVSLLGHAHPVTLHIAANFASALTESGRREDGIGLLRETLRLESSLLGDSHPTVQAHREVLSSWLEDARSVLPTDGRKVGRNQQCPCGSGLKYKRCHGASR